MDQLVAEKVPLKSHESLAAKSAVKFSMRGTPMLASGGRTTPLAMTDNLWLHAKIYSNGGENALHAHTAEDHAFFVLQGKAHFHFGDGSESVLEAFDGFLLPKGAVYRFEAEGEGNLVMLRIGGAQAKDFWTGVFEHGFPREMRSTSVVDGEGKHIPDMRSAQKGPLARDPVVEIPGQFFSTR